jgi:hypothetical protein
MQRKLTLTIDEPVYGRRYGTVGRGSINQPIETLLRPHVIGTDFESAYRLMAEQEPRSREADEWARPHSGWMVQPSRTRQWPSTMNGAWRLCPARPSR